MFSPLMIVRLCNLHVFQSTPDGGFKLTKITKKLLSNNSSMQLTISFRCHSTVSRATVDLCSVLMSAESYAPFKVVSKAVRHKSLDKVFEFNYPVGKYKWGGGWLNVLHRLIVLQQKYRSWHANEDDHEPDYKLVVFLFFFTVGDMDSPLSWHANKTFVYTLKVWYFSICF